MGREAVPLRKAKRGHWIGFDFRFWRNDDTALGCGNPLPDQGLAGGEVHFPAQFGRDGHLTALSDRRFHMMFLSCEQPNSNPDILPIRLLG